MINEWGRILYITLKDIYDYIEDPTAEAFAIHDSSIIYSRQLEFLDLCGYIILEVNGNPNQAHTFNITSTFKGLWIVHCINSKKIDIKTAFPYCVGSS